MAPHKPQPRSEWRASRSSRTSLVWKIVIPIAVVLLAFQMAQHRVADGVKICLSKHGRTQAAPLLKLEDGKEVPHLLDATTDELIAGLEKGSFTSIDLVKTYIERTQQVNATLRAVVEVNPDALSIAAKLDEERASGALRGPLHGLPYLIKNNMATDDEMSTTSGSYALVGAKVRRDAGVVAKLRAAGVVILGKTNLSQWSNFRSTWGSSSNGWSALGGQVIGPYHPEQDPSGSSSGSGVAVAVGLAVAALGTETDGSILYPGSANNIVGIKPTVGLTSRSLVIPISERQDTVGPMARTVKDAAYLLQAIAGHDPFDSYTSAMPFKSIPDYVAACRTDALQGVKIGIPRNMILPKEEITPVLASFEDAIGVIRDAGATIIDETNITAFARDELTDTKQYGRLLKADFLTSIEQYLSGLLVNPNNITTLEQLRQFTHSCTLEAYPDRRTGLWDDALENSLRNDDPRFQPLLERSLRAGGEDGILGVLKNHSLDALILPTQFATSLSARVGAPVVTVPMGHYPQGQKIVRSQRDLVEVAPNIPFGISFLGAKWSETRLISYAYAFEQRTLARRMVSPYITPTSELGTHCS